MQNNIIVKGIRTNNLKNIDIEIFKDEINLILGPSGSGKSTLAYETIAQIGQHEYLSMFADDVFEPTYKVQSFCNMLPAVPIKQSNNNNNLRSTIGTYFGMSKKIILLFSAILNINEDFFSLVKEENLCEKCHGLGFVTQLDVNKIIAPHTAIKDIPFRCWNRYKDFFSRILIEYCEDVGIDTNSTFYSLSSEQQHKLLYEVSERKYTIKYKKVGRTSSRTTKFYGVLSDHDMLPGCSISKAFYSNVECDCCHGRKYNVDHLNSKVFGLSIGEFLTMEFGKLLPIVEKMVSSILDVQLKFVLSELYSFIKKAVELKLGHLSFNRSIPTLSGGEFQRLKLVQVFNTQLSNLLLVLDEPLAGLSINEKPIIKQNIINLAEQNTVLLVDHSTEFCASAKQIICLGPTGGTQGGYIINVDQYLLKQSMPNLFLAPDCDKVIDVRACNSIYQYKGVDVKIALERMNLVTGDSGIGKTTILREYFPQIFDSYIYISQKQIMGNKNSCVATALNVAVRISALYGDRFHKDKKEFSNLTGNKGCCQSCGGAGYFEYGVSGGTTVKVECNKCHGTGFSDNLMQYKIDGKSIFDVWMMTIDEAMGFYDGKDKRLFDTLAVASSVMLGHLRLGQATSSLSGGENIRIKLIKQAYSTAKMIGIDEPFKGLNVTERNAIAIYLDKLRQKGKTIIVIDHTEGIEQFFSFRLVIQNENGMITGKYL